MAPTATAPPMDPTFAKVIEFWTEDPDLTYGDLATRLGMDVFEVIDLVQSNIGEDRAVAA